MIDFLLGMFSWLPVPIQILFMGVISIVIIWLIVKLIIAVIDMIPFA